MAANRRKFINLLLGGGLLGWLGSALYPIISYLIPPETATAEVNSVKAGAVDEYKSNTSKIIKFGRTPVILIRKDDGKFAALAATCTHLDCIVQYRNDSRDIFCACHGGKYDLKGRNLAGPPPRPLEEYAVNIVNDEVIISKQVG